MGLTIENFPIYNGGATVTNAYSNIRNINVTKIRDEFIDTNPDQNKHVIEADATVYCNKSVVHARRIKCMSGEPFTGNGWDFCYTEWKKILTSENLSFTDDV